MTAINVKCIPIFLTTALFLISIFATHAQSASATFDKYAGFWKGDVPEHNPFEIAVTITELENSEASIVLSNQKELLRKVFVLKDTLNIQLDDNLYFEGIVNKKAAQINGFIRLHIDLYPIKLQKFGKHFKGSLNLSANHYLQPESLYLEIRKIDEPGEEFSAYPLLGTYWVNDLQLDQNTISFIDYKTGLKFNGLLQSSEIALDVRLASIDLCQINYRRITKKDKGKVLRIDDG